LKYAAEAEDEERRSVAGGTARGWVFVLILRFGFAFFI
jgi:hypothetical protein